MHQHIREQRNCYFYRLTKLRQIAAITGIEPAVLAVHMHQMRTANLPKDGLTATIKLPGVNHR